MHDLVYHGGGGFIHSEVYNMPTWLRRFHIQKINEHIENLRKRYGQVTHPDSIKKEDMLTVSFQELVDNSPKEGGISNTSSLLVV